jgi:endonuclease/exonuclease/phosphatase family metal-dependent hydrolase
MSYNILNYPGSTSSVRNPYFRTVISSVDPDIIVVQEILSQDGVNEYLNQVLNYNSSEYAAGIFIDGYDTDNAIFYKSDSFTFLANNPISTALRDINEFILSENNTGDTLRIYSLHLKAGSSSSDKQKRFEEVLNLRNVTDNLPVNANYIVCGDFNIYSSNETSYQELLNQSISGYFIDLFDLPGTWNDPDYAKYHTQSPRVRQFQGGATGGMDDRFDMILMSQAVMDSGKIYYLPESFINYGNDGNHYNDSINRMPNTAVSQSIANAIHNASDHLPIFVDLVFEDQISNTIQLSVSISDGWNFVSVPGMNPNGMNVNDWWSDLTGTVYEFTPGFGYSGLTITTTGEGYWMKNDGTTVYNYPTIEIVTHEPISAASGWNMFGGYENEVAVTAITTNPPGRLILPIYKYIPPNGYATASTLKPGYGYWINTSSACDIIIPDGALIKNNEEEKKYFKDDWGRIVFTDADGKKYTLYSVTEEIDLKRYELPPLPPQGMFDIRFASGRIAENIISSMQTIEMRGVKYPLTLRAENMDIIIQDITGHELNAILKDGEDLIITNSFISKLKVSGESIVKEYELEQNYPNPFNPSTTINFSIPKTTEVTLTVYNTLGQKVIELVNEQLETGYYSFNWEAGDAASGIYIYQLKAGEFIQSKKMILIK